MNKKTFAFNESAFSAKDAAHLFLTSANQDSRQKLLEAIRGGCKLITLTGESGVGKSLLVENIKQELGAEVGLIKIQSADLGSDDLLYFIGCQYGIDLSVIQEPSEKTTKLAAQLSAHSVNNNIIQFDQAQLLTEQELGQRLECLQSLNDEVQRHNAMTIQILLLGLPELEMRVMESLLWRFDPNDVCFCRLKPLSGNEIRDYIKLRLDSYESQITTLFSELALQRVISYSAGILRQINKLCDLAMMTAALNGKHAVTAAMIDEVAENCMIVGDEIRTAAEQQENSPKLHVETPESEGQYNDDSPVTSATYKPVLHKTQQLTPAERQNASQELIPKNEDVQRYKRFVLLAAFISVLLGAIVLIPAQEEKSFKPSLWEEKELKLNNKPLQKETTEVSPQKTLAANKPLITEPTEIQIEVSEQQRLQQQLDDLFKLAEQQLAKKQLMTPLDDSAWQTYLKILTMAPDNQTAKAGIKNIKVTYIIWANHEIKKKNYQHAGFLFRKALEISPDDAEIMSTLIWLEIEQEAINNQNGVDP